ncbi:MAG: helix-hairpin-helix domain-containing protein [Oscillospiraceae bacterium]|nr:helix-hairpin-helix domain-containing protein [Oscillospiraceae bacterium]
MENEKRKLRGEKPVSAASAATASRFAAAVGAPAAPAAPAAPVTPAAPVAPAAPAAPAAPVVSAAPKAAPVVETAAAAEPPKRVDVNRCTTQELLELPGMALADASRIVKEREANGPFASVEDCVARVGLKPHLSVRYIGFLTASTAAPASHTRRGRTLDL